jgi:hypothetical protein
VLFIYTKKAVARASQRNAEPLILELTLLELLLQILVEQHIAIHVEDLVALSTSKVHLDLLAVVYAIQIDRTAVDGARRVVEYAVVDETIPGRSNQNAL